MDQTAAETARVQSGLALCLLRGGHLHPRLFDGARAEPHSLNIQFDRAIEAGRLFGLTMDGVWMHVGTPRSIQRAERAIAESATTGMFG